MSPALTVAKNCCKCKCFYCEFKIFSWKPYYLDITSSVLTIKTTRLNVFTAKS